MEELLARLAGLPAWQTGLAAAWLLLMGAVMPSLPEELVVIALGVLCGRGRIGFLEALAAVLAGLLPANLGAVLLGRLLGRGLGTLGPAARVLDSAAVRTALATLRRHGSAFVFLTRFTPFVRGPVYLAAGLARMEIGRFARADALAASLHVPALLWAGWMLGRGAGSLSEALGRVAWVAVGLAALALALHAVRRLLSRDGGGTAAPPASASGSDDSSQVGAMSREPPERPEAVGFDVPLSATKGTAAAPRGLSVAARRRRVSLTVNPCCGSTCGSTGRVSLLPLEVVTARCRWRGRRWP